MLFNYPHPWVIFGSLKWKSWAFLCLLLWLLSDTRFKNSWECMEGNLMEMQWFYLFFHLVAFYLNTETERYCLYFKKRRSPQPTSCSWGLSQRKIKNICFGTQSGTDLLPWRCFSAWTHAAAAAAATMTNNERIHFQFTCVVEFHLFMQSGEVMPIFIWSHDQNQNIDKWKIKPIH